MKLSRLLGETFPMRRWMYVLMALFLSSASCGLFENKKVPPIPPGRRDYTWTVDTLAYEPYGIEMDLWGANPKDVWMVTVNGLHAIWHYNGSVWFPSGGSTWVLN